MFRRHLILTAVLVALPASGAFPSIATAQPRWGLGVQFGAPDRRGPGYDSGYERGVRSGETDARRGERFDFGDESDYRNADIGYRREFGAREGYQRDFRRGFESGYTVGYRNVGGGPGRGRLGGPWNGNIGPGRGNTPWNDPARQFGYNDGYERGLDDGRNGRRFDPIGESRYRSADHGYDRNYGSRELYKVSYREAFRSGYEEGFADAARYARRW